jgi:predicted AlkP superfamily phosphohydrolase/phosphomutase
MIEDFVSTGVMPNIGRVISQGLFRRMTSSIPEVSSVAWSTMITGTNPGEHGIYGFMDLRKDSYRMCFPNYNDLKVRPFWEDWAGRSVIINVPSTYPVREMNGAHISGFVSIDFARSIHPASLVGTLKEMDYRLDVDATKAQESMDAFLADVDATLDARIKAWRYLWENQDWQTFMLVFTGTDRLLHFLWNAYEDPGHKYHDAFLDHFSRIDKEIGEIASRLTENDQLVIHSDHGFERLDYEVFLNCLLMEKGFLEFKPGSDPDWANICHGTKAFVMDPSRIYLNRKGKYPCGMVEDNDADVVLDELEELFGGLEMDGRKVIRDVYRKGDLYSGACIDDAPDMILVGAEGFNLKAGLRGQKVFDKGIFTGKHTQDTAFLVTKGPGGESVVPKEPAVSDIRGIVEKSVNVTG